MFLKSMSEGQGKGGRSDSDSDSSSESELSDSFDDEYSDSGSTHSGISSLSAQSESESSAGEKAMENTGTGSSLIATDRRLNERKKAKANGSNRNHNNPGKSRSQIVSLIKGTCGDMENTLFRLQKLFPLGSPVFEGAPRSHKTAQDSMRETETAPKTTDLEDTTPLSRCSGMVEGLDRCLPDNKLEIHREETTSREGERLEPDNAPPFREPTPFPSASKGMVKGPRILKDSQSGDQGTATKKSETVKENVNGAVDAIRRSTLPGMVTNSHEEKQSDGVANGNRMVVSYSGEDSTFPGRKKQSECSHQGATAHDEEQLLERSNEVIQSRGRGRRSHRGREGIENISDPGYNSSDSMDENQAGTRARLEALGPDEPLPATWRNDSKNLKLFSAVRTPEELYRGTYNKLASAERNHGVVCEKEGDDSLNEIISPYDAGFPVARADLVAKAIHVLLDEPLATMTSNNYEF